MSKLPILSPNQVEQISRILGEAFTNSEIEHALAQRKIPDPEAVTGASKWKRLHNAFAAAQRITQGSTSAVYSFINYCFEPVQAQRNPERYELARLEINKVLMLVGLEIRDDGKYHWVHQAQTASEVEERTRELKNRLTGYGAHVEVLDCCKEELLSEDYFHAVQEAAKSLCDRVRRLSGLTTDGVELFNTAFSISNPRIIFANLDTSSGRNQQNGLKEMLCGVYHMVRNVTAHELRVHWDINEQDAVNILNQISYLHKLLDTCSSAA